MATKDELQQRVDELEAENAALRARADGDDRPVVNYRPSRPFLSEGERQDLEQYGVTNSPFTGEQITATGEGVEPRTATARRADERVAVAGRDRADVVGLDFIPADGVTATGEPASTPVEPTE